MGNDGLAKLDNYQMQRLVGGGKIRQGGLPLDIRNGEIARVSGPDKTQAVVEVGSVWCDFEKGRTTATLRLIEEI
ncbi:MAG: hypothetical protein Q8Q37_01670 [bacterium]|nr:hypothetical protein [bacterium]